MSVQAPISLPLVKREETKSKEHNPRISKKNCRLCLARWLSSVEFLFCKPEYPLTSTKAAMSRIVADQYKKKIISDFNKLIPAIAKAKRDKRPHDAHMKRFDFQTVVENAIKEEAWARINGSHFSTISVERIRSSDEIERLTNYKNALFAATTHWLKVVDTAGYALSLFYRKAAYKPKKTKRAKGFEIAAEDSLIKEIRKTAINVEKEAQECENAFIAGVGFVAKPSSRKRVVGVRVQSIIKVDTSAGCCCLPKRNISEAEAKAIIKCIDM